MGDAGTPGHEGRTRLIIVEDQELLLDALAHSLSLEQDFRVISRLRSAADAGATAFVYKDMPAIHQKGRRQWPSSTRSPADSAAGRSE